MLAVTLEDTRVVRDMIPLHKASIIVTTTLATIAFTNFAMAPWTAPIINLLRLGARQGDTLNPKPLLLNEMLSAGDTMSIAPQTSVSLPLGSLDGVGVGISGVWSPSHAGTARGLASDVESQPQLLLEEMAQQVGAAAAVSSRVSCERGSFSRKGAYSC